LREHHAPGMKKVPQRAGRSIGIPKEKEKTRCANDRLLYCLVLPAVRYCTDRGDVMDLDGTSHPVCCQGDGDKGLRRKGIRAA